MNKKMPRTIGVEVVSIQSTYDYGIEVKYYRKLKVKRFRSKSYRMNHILLKSKHGRIINGYQPTVEGENPTNRPKPPGNE